MDRGGQDRIAENTQDLLFDWWHVKITPLGSVPCTCYKPHLKSGSPGSNTWPHCSQMNQSGRCNIGLN
jgi:hypothetical protein